MRKIDEATATVTTSSYAREPISLPSVSVGSVRLFRRAIALGESQRVAHTTQVAGIFRRKSEGFDV